MSPAEFFPPEKDGWKKKKKKAGRRVNFARVTGLKRELFYSGVKRRGGEGEGGDGIEGRGDDNARLVR